MKIDILYAPESSTARVQLNPGESVVAETSAMVCMSTNVKMDVKVAKTSGSGEGKLKALAKLGKRMMAGESLLQNTFLAEGRPGEVLFAPALPGDVQVINLPQEGIALQSTAYIASTPGVVVEGQFQGMKSFLGLGGLFILKAIPEGPHEQLVFGGFGAIHEMTVDGSFDIDNGHLVAWDSSLTFNNVKAGKGFIGSYLSGEGYLCKFTGSGRVWVQTRPPTGFGEKMARFLEPI